MKDLNAKWQECRYGMRKDGAYFAHSPIYGSGQKGGRSEVGIVARYIRIENVLRALSNIGIDKGRSLLDVGCSEGHFLSIARDRFDCRVYGVDISHNACKMAIELFGIDAHKAVATDLWFPDGWFDFVVCMETLEHIPDVHKAIEELLRVSRRGVIITVPNESVRKTTRTHVGIKPLDHLWNFKHDSFDFLMDMGYHVKVVRHTSTIGLFLYMFLEKARLLNDFTTKVCLKIDRLIQHIPPSWGWMFIITPITKETKK